MPTVLTSIEDTNDDAITYPSEQFELTANSVYLGNDGGPNNSYLRFRLAVPPDVSIEEAHLVFKANVNLSTDTVHVTFYYEDADNPADFSAESYASMEAKARSSISINWDFTTDWVSGTEYDSISLLSLIQALVEESYWSYNDYCVIIIEDNSSDSNAERRAYDYTASSSDVVRLVVTYREPRPPAALNELAIY